MGEGKGNKTFSLRRSGPATIRRTNITATLRLYATFQHGKSGVFNALFSDVEGVQIKKRLKVYITYSPLEK